MLEIDGSRGEGGGQVLRSCLSLSLLTGKAFTIFNIRAGRPRPGLRPQHLASVRAAAAISGAKMQGADLSSRRLSFCPGAVRPGRYRFDIGTAGSVSLVFQTIFLPLALAGSLSRIEFTGGTHVPWSPCFHYLREVFLPVVGAMGFKCRVTLKKWGFYPKGGGVMEAFISPSRPEAPFLPQYKEDISIYGISASAGLPGHVRIRQAGSARNFLLQHGFDPLIAVEEAEASCPGSLLFLWTSGEGVRGGFTSLGKRGKSAEKVGREAARKLLAFLESRAACDKYLSDQLILPAALNPGISRWTTEELTGHLLTNASIAEKFLSCRIICRADASGSHLIEVKGGVQADS